MYWLSEHFTYLKHFTNVLQMFKVLFMIDGIK